MLVTTAIARRVRPELPTGRHVMLPGRGVTWVREAPGPLGGPAIVLLHGWSGTADLHWHPYFESLGGDGRVVAPDLRGHGRGLKHGDPFRLEDCADDVAALIETLGLGRCVLVGYSMGGAVAQLVWRRHRDVVAGLVFCSTSATFRSTARLRLLFGAAAGVGVVGASSTLNSVAGSAFGALARWNGLRGEDVWGIDQLARHDWGQVIEAGNRVGRFDARHWIGTIDVPTSVIATLGDDVVPTRHQVALAEAIPGATVRFTPGGHHLCVTDPDAFTPVIAAACREVVGRSSAVRASGADLVAGATAVA